MSLERLTNGGMTCSYNGYTFGPTADTTAFSVRPNLDPARRTVMSATYRIKVQEYIADAGLTDASVLDAIQRLSRNAGKIRYEGRGFGDLVINFFGGDRDVSWGPITLAVGCEAVGGGQSVLLTWEVEFTTVNCPDGLTVSGTPLQFTFGVTYALDKEGYTTRTYDASLTIAQTKITVADARLTATADQQREKMMPAVPAGFRRASHSHKLSLDKCTLAVNVVDSQLPPNPPPVGVVDGSIEHTYATGQGAAGILKWSGSLSATFDIARPDGTPDMAVNAFLALMKARLALARGAVVGAGLPEGFDKFPDAGVKGKNAPVILTGTSVFEPNVIGRTQVKIGISYMMVGMGLGEILRTGGLWTRPPDQAADPATAWGVWLKSVASALSPRGSAVLAFRPGDDRIVDACVPGATITTGIPGIVPGANRNQFTPGLGDSILQKFRESFPAPGPASSWLRYRNDIVIHPDLGRVSGSTLPDTPLPTYSANRRATGWDVTKGVFPGIPAKTSPYPPLDGLLAANGQLQGGETFYQQRTRPSLLVTMTGEALRAGYDIPVPELVSVNGTKPVLVGQPTFRSGVVASCSVPIIGATWNMTYLFTDAGGTPAGGFSVLPNPYLA